MYVNVQIMELNVQSVYLCRIFRTYYIMMHIYTVYFMGTYEVNNCIEYLY